MTADLEHAITRSLFRFSRKQNVKARSVIESAFPLSWSHFFLSLSTAPAKTLVAVANPPNDQTQLLQLLNDQVERQKLPSRLIIWKLPPFRCHSSSSTSASSKAFPCFSMEMTSTERFWIFSTIQEREEGGHGGYGKGENASMTCIYILNLI